MKPLLTCPAAAAGKRGFAGAFCVEVIDCEEMGGLDTWVIIPRGGTAIAGIPGPLFGCILQRRNTAKVNNEFF